MIRTPAGLPKTNQNSSPTPANPQVWPMRQQPQPEGYQYSQLSPSRSPSGPTYTQLSSGINSRPAYHTATSAQQQGPQPGKIDDEIDDD
jgi:aryl hydrocarbon receptor nuclear translocator